MGHRDLPISDYEVTVSTGSPEQMLKVWGESVDVIWGSTHKAMCQGLLICHVIKFLKQVYGDIGILRG